jgi:Flp pilus assembly pilin Flp
MSGDLRESRREKGRKSMLLTYLRARLEREEGQALVEYALIITLIALVCVAGLTVAGDAIDGMLSGIADQL